MQDALHSVKSNLTIFTSLGSRDDLFLEAGGDLLGVTERHKRNTGGEIMTPQSRYEPRTDTECQGHLLLNTIFFENLLELCHCLSSLGREGTILNISKQTGCWEAGGGGAKGHHGSIRCLTSKSERCKKCFAVTPTCSLEGPLWFSPYQKFYFD
jgi:hypothetical protein